MRALAGILFTVLAAVIAAAAVAAQAPADKPSTEASGSPGAERPEPALPPVPPAESSAAPVAKAPAAPPAGAAAKAAENQLRPNHCVDCHSSPDIWAADTLKYYVTEKDFANDIHWQKGLRCPDCHGGDPTTNESVAAGHAGFRPLKSRTDVVKLCGDCHANIEYMRRFNPSPRVDQLSEYWTSDHGHRLKERDDQAVAVCTSCHGKPHGNAADKTKHGILAVNEPDSPVFPTNVAKTCAHCHSDAKVMAGRTYHGRPIGHDQYELWQKSVHAEALLKKGDLSAATCNKCHGNHGAVPPQVGSVANACGICHGRIAELFNATAMKHGFEKVGLPGCVTCHSNHLIGRPSTEMLGMDKGAVCIRCHSDGKFGATLAGADVARKLRSDLDGLRDQIQQASALIERASQLGMEVSGPSFDLHKATDSLKNARVQMHSFAIAPVEKTLEAGRKTAVEVLAAAEASIKEYHHRRIWLATSLVPIVIVIGLLLLYIRRERIGRENESSSR